MPKFVIGLDFGTHAVRAVAVNVANGRELASASWNYAHGRDGILTDDNLAIARQHPADYIKGLKTVLKRTASSLKRAAGNLKSEHLLGIAVAATGSTPIPVDRRLQPLAFKPQFENNLNAMAWLWKDHSAATDADKLTAEIRRFRPQYLVQCGGTYSAENYFAKILCCLRVAPKVFDNAFTWLELSDYIPAVLTGCTNITDLTANRCAAGYKALYNPDWGGYPDEKFLRNIDPKLADLSVRMPSHFDTTGQPAGRLCAEWAKDTGLPEGVLIAVGGVDGHLSAIGCGLAPGTLVKVMGTSGSDMALMPKDPNRLAPEIPGLCGRVENGIVPGHLGLEAGQPAVGDVFASIAALLQPGQPPEAAMDALTRAASRLNPGQSGLLALSWLNGNRSLLGDPRLSGLMVGQTLHTTPADVFRAHLEGVAFGSRMIIRQLERYRIPIETIVAAGGVTENNPLAMQILADVTGRVIRLPKTRQAAALGAAVSAAVAGGAYPSIAEAQEAMCGLKRKTYKPNPAATAVYKRLFYLYRTMHNAFGTVSWKGNLFDIMKELLSLKQETL